MRTGCEREEVEITHRCRGFIMLVNAGANANSTQGAIKTVTMTTRQRAKPRAFNPTRHRAATSVNSENLVRRASVAQYKGHYKKEANQGDRGSSKFTNLLDGALCCAIWTSYDDSIVSPPDIKDATHGLQNVGYEKGGLSFKSNKSGEEGQEGNH